MISEAEWHRIASAEEVIWEGGEIVGVVEEGKEIRLPPITACPELMTYAEATILR